MSEAQQRLQEMDRAEERGDHGSARTLARSILASGERAIGPAGDDPNEETFARKQALELLARTEPDSFLFVVGMLGLGLTVWLVYNYIL